MKIRVITPDGREYVSQEAENDVNGISVTNEEIIEALYEEIENITKFKMETADGEVVVFPQETIRNSTIIFENLEK